MTIAVAHQVSATSRLALVEAVKEANYRGTDLAVLHVVDSIDADNKEAYRLGVADEIEKVVGAGPPVSWQLHLETAGGDLGDALLRLVDAVKADLLVIGARRRSPMGKALLGSVAQTVILEANLPVLVVKVP
jgi:nucleotide-binding universal stress UspA family protein